MKVLALAVLFTFATAGFAQDVIVGPTRLVPAVSGTEVPKVKGHFRPGYPEALRAADEIGYVVATRTNDEKGNLIAMQVTGTHVPFQRAVEEPFGRMKMTPARRDGGAVTTRVWMPIIFNPKSSSEKLPDASPRLLTVSPVVTPKSPAPADSPPLARVRLKIDAAGNVADAAVVHELEYPMQRLIAEQVKDWKFAPARKGDSAVDSEITMLVICQPPWRDNGPQVVPPRAKRRGLPRFPPQMEQYGFNGEVSVTFTVDAAGRVQNPVVRESSNPGFNEAALEAVRESTFEPGTRDGKPIAMPLTVAIKFRHPFNNEQYGVKEAWTKRDVPEALRYDTPPKLRGVVPPVYPYALRKEKVRGSATVLILIDPRGTVTDVQSVESTHPEFALAAKAAAEAFAFDPATRDGKVVPSIIKHTQKFDPRSLPDPDAERLLQWESDRPEKIVAASKLDAPPKPISRKAPVFPRDHRVKGTLSGKAVVEALVDDEGHVRLARIISASEDGFGYAVAQSVSLWQFEVPRLAGKPVCTRVQVPFSFRLEPEQ